MRTEVVEKRLNSLPDLSRLGKRVNGLHRLLACPRIWELAYEAIAPNKGALTPGADPNNTLDGFSLERMTRIITAVQDGTYRFTPVRRHYIPKTNGKLRPLGIPSADDKLVQAAVKLVLGQIYEPIFSENSHGFRSGHSCHTALDQIRGKWSGVTWLVDVDIVGFFDNIDHGILLDLLRKRINDEDFLRLIKRMLTAGFMEDWTWHPTYSGTPQGGVISPLLANVYLHELDEHTASLKAKFDKGRGRRITPEYRQQSKLLEKHRRHVKALRSIGAEEAAQEHLEVIRELHAALIEMPCVDPFDPGFKRLLYIRYADDFLIGILGSKQDAANVMAEVTAFLKSQLKLDVSEEKSGIHRAAEGTSFLGYTVHTYTSNRVLTIHRKGQCVATRRTASRLMQLRADRAKLASFVERKKFGNYHTGQADAIGHLTGATDLEILVSYNVMMRGLAEYYKRGNRWRRDLTWVSRIWWFSLMKTLATKHKCSVNSVLNNVLTRRLGERGLWYENKGQRKFMRVFYLRHVSDGEPAKPDFDKERVVTLSTGRSSFTDRLRARTCEGCGAEDVPLEIHHAKKLADVKHQSLAAQVKAARTRKRVALCVPCHHALHAGVFQARIDRLKADVGAG